MNQRIDDLKAVVDVAVGAIGCMSELTKVGHGAAEVSKRTQALAAAAEEMVASVAEISASSHGAADDAEEARHVAADGLKAVESAVRTVNAIAQSVDETTHKVDRLSEASTRIGSIVNSIEAIAKQTNLLALNATIEAARAGEAGKGFAVVAGEVKNLANQTAKATVDIRQLIETLRLDIAAIVESMQASAVTVAEGEKVITETGEKIAQITDRADGVTVKMREIANILGQQGTATGEIAQGVAAIADMSKETDAEIAKMLGGLDGTFGILTRQIKSYEDCTSDQAILAFGRSDHVAFKKRVLDGVLGRISLHAQDLPDHCNCRLGKWYLSAKTAPVGSLPSFARLDPPHAAVHAHGKKALDCHDRGDFDAALREVHEMEQSSQQVLAVLEALAAEAG